MGGYVAAPVMLAAILARVPIVVLEPNAMPGLVTRRLSSFVRMALISWPETSKWFPAGRVELTGLPVRDEFFAIPERPLGRPATVLVTGGSRGASALNRASRESWPLFRAHDYPVRFILQCGPAEYESLANEFNASGLEGEVCAFIHDMPAAYSVADIVISRSGAGAVAEISASGRAALLVPFPYATDDHQRHNAEGLARVGGARILSDQELSGDRLFHIVTGLIREPGELAAMGRAARRASHSGAARRAAECLIQQAVRR
jgi:UDP-N-acetylglucosamine--N-acetylmuramyl-(pentapeptide) pyrophosphoryl-undecaprenol N-acetylglucosamine transferase